jgi:molybdopterin molybdotransferase
MAKPGFSELVSLSRAKEILFSLATELPEEKVPLSDSLFRVLSRDIVSPIPVPSFERSAMDGFAVVASSTFGAGAEHPASLKLSGKVVAGEMFSGRLKEGECVEISTGAPLPEGADAVVMVEYTEREKGHLLVYRRVAPGDSVSMLGSDIEKGAVVLKKGGFLQPKDTGVLAAIGMLEVPVKRRPEVALLVTGNELLPPGSELAPGKIYDINSRTLSDSLRSIGASVIDLGVAPDDRKEIERRLRKAIPEADLLVMTGGSSLGAEDLTLEVARSLGKVLIHGIAVKPGKPVVIARVSGKPFLGIPGHPTSALSSFYILIEPLIYRMLGASLSKKKVEAVLTRKVASTIGRYQFLSVSLEERDDIIYAHPIMKGSSAISTMTLGNGFIGISENTEVLEKGTKVIVELF